MLQNIKNYMVGSKEKKLLRVYKIKKSTVVLIKRFKVKVKNTTITYLYVK